MNAELLKKTAALLRSQEEEKQSISKKLEEAQKEATVTRTVLNMLKESILDVDEIDTKMTEFNTNSDLLSKTAEYFDKKATSAGTVKDAELPTGMDPEAMFAAALQG